MSDPQYTVWLDDDFGEWVKGLQDKYHIPGTSVAVVDNGRVESAGYGFARLPDVPATADTLYQMCSTSKAITAATMGLILKDHEKNKLPDTKTARGESKKMSWDTPLVDILGDDFDVGDSFLTQNITIEDALSHRSGLAGHDLFYGPRLGAHGTGHTSALRHLGAARDHFRIKFQYCNAMYGAVGHIFEKIDGGFDSAARKRIFEPLGMNDTFCGFHSPAVPKNGGPNLARGYHWIEENDQDQCPGTKEEQKGETNRGYYVGERFVEIGPIMGAAGNIVSSVKDYSKWVTAMLEASQAPDTNEKKAPGVSSREKSSVISHELWKELTTPRTMLLPAMSLFPDINPNLEDVDINPPLYALGWFSGPYMFAGHTIIHHSGGIPGFGTHVFLLPKHKLGIVIASNRHLISNKLAEQIGREIIGKKVGISMDERRCQGKFAPVKDEPSPTETDSPKEEDPLAPVSTADILSESSLKQEEPVTVDTDGLPDSFNLEAVLGVYQNGAYGQYKVSTAEVSATMKQENPSLNGVKIVRKSSTSTTQSKSKFADLALKAEPDGRRSLRHTVMLHPPSAAAKSAQTAEHAFFTLEVLWAHGDLMVDPIPDIPLGHGDENDPKYPLKQEPVWEGGAMGSNIKCGACIEFKDGVAVKLGMVLANTWSMEAGMRKGDKKELPLEDFERKMVWFDKVN